MSGTVHSIPQFHEAMEQVHQSTIRVGRLVKAQLEGALESLQNGDVEQAKKIKADDEAVDHLEKVVDDECTKLLARHSPVAGDLRKVIVILKTITDFERIGDETGHIAEQASSDNAMPSEIREDIKTLGKKVLDSLEQLLQHFESMNSAKSRDLAGEDEEINRQANNLIQAALASNVCDTFTDAQSVISMIWCVRSLERIGDHIKNVSQYLVYYAEGVDIRH